MTGFQSKKAAALDKLDDDDTQMYLVHHTQPTSLNGYIKKIEDLIQERDTWKAAAQRPWVALTEEEIDDIFWQHESRTEHQVPIYPYERAIEAKLKDKNS
jgi:hypothetical protein